MAAPWYRGGVLVPETRKLLLEFETEEVGRLARKDDKEKKALIKAFSDSSDLVRERALLAAIDVADPTLVTEIVRAMGDDVADVRIAAAQALAFYGQPVTVPNMLECLKDENTWVRSHCAAGLSKLLSGPIWARIPTENVDKILNGYPDMTEEEIDTFLKSLKLRSDAMSRLRAWQAKNFEIDIDISSLVEELEGKPILLSEEAAASAKMRKPSPSDEVEEILSELPEEMRKTLPAEDVRRLTPESARELVRQLKVSAPTKEKKKAVKVKKVKKVRKKKDETSHDGLIKKLPTEVRESVGDSTLAELSTEELEALLAASGEEEQETPAEPEDSRWAELADKYGKEKAEILFGIPENLLEDIPEDQIKEMDIETLKGLAQALEPR
jgi:putative heme iron utilization protein